MDDDAKHGCLGMGCILLIVMLIFVVGALTGGIPYSEGFRQGYIQKISKKGIFWVTTEGELALEGFRVKNKGTSNTFEFTVPDYEIAAELEALSSKDEVRLYYIEYMFSPPWKGESAYRVYKWEKR